MTSYLILMDNTCANVTFASFNCKNIVRSADCVRKLCTVADVIALQETWLLPHDVPYLGNIQNDYAYTGKSALDTSSGVLKGRPYGGVALLWKKSVFPSVATILCHSDRITCIKIEQNNCSLLVFSVYMPTDNVDNLIEFTECLSEIISIIESSDVESVLMLGDFNAHPGTRFSSELLTICTDQMWTCIDMDLLPPDTHTFISSANGSLRWLDHCIVTSAARPLVVKASVIYDVFVSDHLPMLIECNISLIKPKIKIQPVSYSKVVWGERSEQQIKEYFDYCNSKLRLVDFPTEFCDCANSICNEYEHCLLLDKMYQDLVTILMDGAKRTYVVNSNYKRRKCLTGWNKYVRDAHCEARLHYKNWILYGKPDSGYLYEQMCNSRKNFKNKLKFIQDNQNQMKMDKIAQCHSDKQFHKFWKLTKKLNNKLHVPVSVANVHEPIAIANEFRTHFQVVPQIIKQAHVSVARVVEAGNPLTIFSAKSIANIIKKW
jgi:exonuclease III